MAVGELPFFGQQLTSEGMQQQMVDVGVRKRLVNLVSLFSSPSAEMS